MSVTEPLRKEHRELWPSIEALAQHLIPHAEAEDQVLYPTVDRLIGDRSATRPTDTTRRDFAKEEEVYLPLLDRELSAADASALFAEMESVKPVSSGSGQEPSGPHSAEERQ